jgi:hypothetical protein
MCGLAATTGHVQSRSARVVLLSLMEIAVKAHKYIDRDQRQQALGPPRNLAAAFEQAHEQSEQQQQPAAE